MSAESVYLAVVLLAALVSFYTQWLRSDVTALLVMLALLLPWRPTAEGLRSVLEPEEAFHGFGSSALVMVAAMFVLSAGMVHTGAARLLGGRLLAKGGKSELRFQLTILVWITLFSAVINDTTTVLVWMPPIMAICRERGYSPSRVLILLAYASLLGGQWTLIGTRSNVILSDYLRGRSGEGLDFFAFTPVAAAVWLGCCAWFFLFGRRWLPKARHQETLESRYEIAEYLTEAMAEPGSVLIGRTLAELDLPGTKEITVLQVIRGSEFLPPNPWLRVLAGDVLVIQGRMDRIAGALRRPGLNVREELRIDDKILRSADLRMVEAILPPDSKLERHSLRDLDFHHRYGVSPLAIGRGGRSLVDRPLSEPLRAGDSLLLIGHEAELERLRNNPDLVLLESRTLPAGGRTKTWLMLLIMAAMVLACATKLLAPAVAIPFAAMLAILTGCVGMRAAYEAIDLQALVIVGAMIPFGHALQKTGTAQLVADQVAGGAVGQSPHLLLFALLLMAVLFTQLIENAAVAVILSPIAYEMAAASGANPMPFVLGVAICVSSAFMTPMAHESTILVMGPGRYRFRDYLVVGAPFALITWIVTSLTIPLLHPLRG